MSASKPYEVRQVPRHHRPLDLVAMAEWQECDSK